LLPLARGRFVDYRRADGRPMRAPRGFGEWRLSSRGALESFETITAGRFWSDATPGSPEVSLDERFADGLGIHVGDVMTFEIGGRRIETPVTSLRRAERRMRSLASYARFDILLRPGTLDGSPYMLIGTLKGPADRAARAALQNAFMEQFPNVTLIDALDDIEEIRARVDEVSFGVSILGGFVFASGTLILVGSIAMTKRQRLYEAAILKTLGAKKKTIAAITLVEYGVLGLLAGVIGSAGAIGVTWAMTRFGRSGVVWHAHPLVNVAGVIVTMVLVTIVGQAASWDVMMKKPLGILREES
jgi:putative ABC transport system permease protein